MVKKTLNLKLRDFKKNVQIFLYKDRMYSRDRLSR